MKTLIISTAEIKVILGITESGNDALIDVWNKTITEWLCDYLGIQDFGSHEVINERVKVGCNSKLYLEQFPIDLGSAIILKTVSGEVINGYTFGQDPRERRTVRLYDSSGYPSALPYQTVLVSYTTGYKSDVPQTLKTAIALMVGGGIAEKDSKFGNIESYSIGDKTVNFRSASERNLTESILKKWLSVYKKTRITAL